MQWSPWIWLRDYTWMTKVKSREWIAHCRRHIISIYTHHVHPSVLLCVCPFPTRYSSISAILNKPILDFSLSLIWAFPPGGPPSCIPCQSNGIFSYQPAYQIQIPMMDKSAWADALECRLLLSINVLPDDCVLLECMTLRGLFEGPAELQWPQLLKVNFRHWSPFWNLYSPGKAQFIPFCLS